MITFGDELFRAPEALFNPLTIGLEEGIVERLYQCIMSCDIDMRSDLYSIIVLSGGNSMLRGLPERIERGVTSLAPAKARVKPKVIAFPSDRVTPAWVGGSIITSLSSFQDTWISKLEYDEHGPHLV